MTIDDSAAAEGAVAGAAAGPKRDEAVDASPRVVTSDSLFGGAAQLAIMHRQTIYFLRQTRFGKLILTK
jgi:hemin uptake protein HemP